MCSSVLLKQNVTRSRLSGAHLSTFDAETVSQTESAETIRQHDKSAEAELST